MKKAVYFLIGLLLVVFIGITAPAKVRQWNQRKLVSAAIGFAQKGDFNSAALTARQVLQRDPSCLSMCLLMAKIADRVDSQEAILWWSRVVKMDGGTFSSIAALVSVALRFEETGVAADALDQTHESDRKTAAYHQLRAGVAFANQQFQMADAEFTEAARIEPQNELIQLNLATLHLLSTSAKTRNDAKAMLEDLQKKPEFRLSAQRALLTDAKKHGEPEKALQLARAVADDPNCKFEDQLVLLDETHTRKQADFEGRLKAIQEKAGGIPALIRKLVHWMNSQDMAGQSLAWLRSLPPNIQTQPTVQFATAESLAVLGKWEELRAMLIKCNWQELDFLRFAIQARAARETLHTSESVEKWEKAVIATNGEVRMQSMLARLVSGWGWNPECEQVWWLIARHSSGQRSALQSLYKLYSDAKNTPQLYKVIERVYEVEPNSPAAINNMAAVSLLLGKNLGLAHQLALKNYTSYPKNPGAASTYAYSLYCQKKGVEGLKILAAFPEETVRQPAIAVYYGLLLAQAGEAARAAVYLDIAKQSGELLPEEKALVAQALPQ